MWLLNKQIKFSFINNTVEVTNNWKCIYESWHHQQLSAPSKPWPTQIHNKQLYILNSWLLEAYAFLPTKAQLKNNIQNLSPKPLASKLYTMINRSPHAHGNAVFASCNVLYFPSCVFSLKLLHMITLFY